MQKDRAGKGRRLRKRALDMSLERDRKSCAIRTVVRASMKKLKSCSLSQVERFTSPTGRDEVGIGVGVAGVVPLERLTRRAVGIKEDISAPFWTKAMIVG